jgi:DNA-binding NtrC family response regulator
MSYKKEEQSHQNKTRLDRPILVIEDDDSIGPLLIAVLSQETPYKALLVTDAFQALKTVMSIKPCLFITDYHLPHMDGIELYDRLHSTIDMADTPAIIMSAHLPTEEIKKRHLVSLSKPFELDELLDTIEKLLA